MKNFMIACAMALLGVPASSVLAQPAPAARPVKLGSESDLGTLLDNPAAKAVLEKYIPQLISSSQISMARSMTLKQLQQYAGDRLSDEVLGKIDYDLAKIQTK